VTGVVDRLERAVLARRVPDPDDRRRVSIEVTPKFYDRAGEIWGPLKADWDATLSRRFTTDELERMGDEVGRATPFDRADDRFERRSATQPV